MNCFCGKKIRAKNYCNKHYQQVKLYGHTFLSHFDKNKIIKKKSKAYVLLRNKFHTTIAKCIIDLDDIDKIKLYKWHLHHNGYAINKQIGSMHRLILTAEKKQEIDHINHNRLDNRKRNLRLVTKSQNQMNKKIRKDTPNGICGVYFRSDINKWRVNIQNKTLGHFKTKKEAIAIRKNAEKEIFGEFRYK